MHVGVLASVCERIGSLDSTVAEAKHLVSIKNALSKATQHFPTTVLISWVGGSG